MNWKFWKRQTRIPNETQTELIDLRAKVAEYANLYIQLEVKHELFIQLALHYFRTFRANRGNGDKQIADNMRSFWKESADGAER